MLYVPFSCLQPAPHQTNTISKQTNNAFKSEDQVHDNIYKAICSMNISLLT